MSNIRKKELLVIGIIMIAIGVGTLSFLFYKQNNKLNINKDNIVKDKDTQNIHNNKIDNLEENNKLKKDIVNKVKEKKENQNKWVFTAEEHKAIRKNKGKDYIIDFKYGVGYVNKFGNIIYGIDPKIENERELIKEKVIKEIKGYCKLNKFQIKDYGGLEGMKKFFDKLFTYYNGNVFLEKEKIDLTQKYVDRYCKVYNPLLKEIIKKAVVLSFFNFDTSKCKVNISGKDSINIVCEEGNKMKNLFNFYVSIRKINLTTTKDIIKKEKKIDIFYIK